MVDVLKGHEFQVEDQTTYYLEAGPEDGPLLIFIHGWPDIALTWQYQMKAFAGLGFRVAAPDTRGYGKSSAPRDKRAYRMEQLVKEQLALLKQLGRDKAIWVAHDWGSGILSALAAHHPEVLQGAVWLAVQYRTIELGLKHLVTLVNRDMYPEAEYPYGQWEYMKFYEEQPDASDKQLGPVSDKVTKILYSRSNPATFGKPSPNSRTIRSGGFFGGNAGNLPDVPLEATSLDPELYQQLLDSHKRHGWWPATAYYLNHDVNEVYDESRKNDGVLDVPCLFIDAKYDAICSATTTPRNLEPMRKACKNLTEAWIESNHWLHLEKPTEVNAVLAKWLAESLPELWPYAGKVPVHKL